MMVAAPRETETAADFVAGFCEALGQMIDRQWAAPVVPELVPAKQLPSLDALDLVGISAFLVDDRAQILSANPSARALIEIATSIQEIEGRLTAPDKAGSLKLSTLIRGAACRSDLGFGAEHAGAVELVATDGGDGLTLLITPYPPPPGSSGEQSRRALICIRTQPGRLLSAKLLHDLYGLTAAQAAVAERLAAGASVEEVAEMLDISRHTARSHLRQIFAKTGTARQSQLISLLLRGVLTLNVHAAGPRQTA